MTKGEPGDVDTSLNLVSVQTFTSQLFRHGHLFLNPDNKT